MPLPAVAAFRCAFVLFDLDRRMRNAEALAQHAFDCGQRVLSLRMIGHARVQRGDAAAPGELPDVDMVYAADAGFAFDRRRDRSGFHVVRSAFKQDVGGPAQQLPRAAENQQRDENRQDRISRDPAEIADQQCGDDRDKRSQQVADDVQARAGSIDVIVIVRADDAQDQRVDEQSGHGDDQHQARLNRVRSGARRVVG